MSSRLLPLLRGSVLFATLPSTALALPQCEEYMTSRLPWLPGQATSHLLEDFDSVVHGYLVGDDTLLDVAVIEDGELWILDGVGERHLLSDVPNAPADFTALTLEPSAVSGQPDRLILSNGGGLWAYGWDAATEVIVQQA